MTTKLDCEISLSSIRMSFMLMNLSALFVTLERILDAELVLELVEEWIMSSAI